MTKEEAFEQMAKNYNLDVSKHSDGRYKSSETWIANRFFLSAFDFLPFELPKVVDATSDSEYQEGFEWGQRFYQDLITEMLDEIGIYWRL